MKCSLLLLLLLTAGCGESSGFQNGYSGNAISTENKGRIAAEPPALLPIDVGSPDDRVTALSPKTTADKAWLICRIDKEMYERVTVGIEGTLSFLPKYDAPLTKAKKQIACLKEWKKLTGHHASYHLLGTE